MSLAKFVYFRCMFYRRRPFVCTTSGFACYGNMFEVCMRLLSLTLLLTYSTSQYISPHSEAGLRILRHAFKYNEYSHSFHMDFKRTLLDATKDLTQEDSADAFQTLFRASLDDFVLTHKRNLTIDVNRCINDTVRIFDSILQPNRTSSWPTQST